MDAKGRALAVERIGNLPSLRKIVPQWWGLWHRVPSATPFQSPAWLISWYECFTPGPLRCFAVYDLDRLVALGLFYLDTEAAGNRLLPLGKSISDYLDVLVEPAYESAAGTLLLTRMLLGEQAGALCCEELSPCAAALRMWGGYQGHLTLTHHSACPVLEIGRSRPAIPKRKLRKLRMARHRVERHQGVIVEPQRDSLREFLEGLFRLHTARWRSREQLGVLADDRVQLFHERVLPGLCDAGVLRLFGLRISGQLIGVYYGFQRRDRAYAYLTGFDPEFAYCSPGTVLVWHAIERAMAEGASEFHFLRGREGYKYEWGAVDRWNLRLEIRQPT